VIFHQVFNHVLSVEAAIAGLVFVIVLGLLVVAVLRRRAGSGRQPSQRSERNRLEWAYVVLLAGVAGFLVYFTANANSHERQAPGPAATHVAVTAYRWCWQFRYPGQPVDINGACTTGKYPTIVVPTGRPVELTLTSQDVIHSFWVPALDVKVDTYPDHTNVLTMSFDRPGQWLGRCAEFCGTYHTTMDFYLRAVSPDQYRQWLQQHGGSA
jgi:cytochrome c oxidase subunit 2